VTASVRCDRVRQLISNRLSERRALAAVRMRASTMRDIARRDGKRELRERIVARA